MVAAREAYLRVRQFLAGRLFITVLDLTALLVFVPDALREPAALDPRARV